MTTYLIETGASTRSKSRQNMTHVIEAETEEDAYYEARVAHQFKVGWNASIWIKSCEPSPFECDHCGDGDALLPDEECAYCGEGRDR